MSYQLYRNTTLGNTLQESLDELISYGQITPQLALKGLLLTWISISLVLTSWIFAVLLQFDKSINSALSNKVKSRITFKASKLNTYRFCDNVWTLMWVRKLLHQAQKLIWFIAGSTTLNSAKLTSSLEWTKSKLWLAMARAKSKDPRLIQQRLKKLN